MTPEQQEAYDAAIAEAERRAAVREKGFFGELFDPMAGENLGIPAGTFIHEKPAAATIGPDRIRPTGDPLMMLDILGRGLRMLGGFPAETLTAAPGETPNTVRDIATDILTDPLAVWGLTKVGVGGIRSLLDDALTAQRAAAEPGVANMFDRIRPQQLDELARELEQGLAGNLITTGQARVAIPQALRPMLADQRGVLMGQGTMFGKEPYGLYSQMGRVLEQKLPHRATGEDIWGLVQNWVKKGEFKAEEVRWTELEEFLKAPRPGGPGGPARRISKDEVLEYVEANNLQLEEVVRTGEDVSSTYQGYIMRGGDEGENYREVILRLPKLRAKWSGSHYSDWDDVVAHLRIVERKLAVPGGPPQRVLFIEELQSDWHQAGRRFGYKSREEVERLAAAEAALDGAQNAKIALERQHGTNISRLGDQRYQLQRQLEDMPYTGEPGAGEQMFLPGREEGIRERLAIMDMQMDELREAQERVSAADNALYSLREAQRRQPPEAPFQKTWPHFAFKRMFQKAVDEGFDQLQWTTGRTQNLRYPGGENQAFFVDSMEWEKLDPEMVGPFQRARGEGEAPRIRLTYKVIEDGEVSSAPVEKIVDQRELDGYLGKDLSKKIRFSDEATGYVGPDEADEIVQGPFSDEKGLMVGGEALRWFYDDEMFRAAREVVKKHGGKVKQAPMSPIHEIRTRVHPHNADTFWDWLDSRIAEFGRKLNTADTAAERGIWRRKIRNYKARQQRQDLNDVSQEIVDDFLAKYPKMGLHTVDDPSRRAGVRRRAFGLEEPIVDHPMAFRDIEEAERAASPTVWTVEITPEMKQSIKKKGASIFEILMGAGTGGAAGRTAAEAMAVHERETRPTNLIEKSRREP